MLVTKRLRLRPMLLGDASSLFNVWSDEETTKYMDIEPLTSLQQAEEMISFFIVLTQRGKGHHFTLVTEESKDIIGTCGFHEWNHDHHRAEIGYELSRDYWGHGYMKEALHILLHTGLHQYGLKRIEAKIDPHNHRSRYLLESLGFQKEGVLRSYEELKGRRVDLELYSLLKEEFTLSLKKDS
ncbi:GNAT family N-acetyltransferase [Priestia endophytica]|uniref:GNAT family N-acetyltransferase n=1 Tax=Priestia endophytica TaxID=135735 RepID=UPI000DCA4E3E|nr:GNAT family protein [Priestia endophytica]RAS81080.1 GNAT family N-acetyltransferase [Priestia endophytica]